MRVLVTFASRYGGTAEIAERIARRLRSSGLEVDVAPVDQVGPLEGYDAAVVGGAVYFGHWLKPMRRFLARHSATLVESPTWLFSSGPLGTETTDDQGRDLRTAAEPAELADALSTVRPRSHTVFYGVLVPGRLGLRDRAIRALPAGRRLLPEGDFRDWEEIDRWADQIAHDLGATAADGGE